MDKQELIRLVVQNVSKKLADIGEQVSEQEILACMGITETAADDRPGLLILRTDHGEGCHELYESAALNEKYHMECALLDESAPCLDNAEAVILFDLTNENLSKLYNGIGDTPFTSMAVQAILSGKTVYAVREGIELFDYEKTAPAVYYQMMKKQLAFLKECGMQICCRDKIEGVLLGRKADAGAVSSAGDAQEAEKAACEKAEQREEKELNLTKKVITERDIIEADKEKVTCIRIRENSILTDLAKDMARKRDIRLLRN